MASEIKAYISYYCPVRNIETRVSLSEASIEEDSWQDNTFHIWVSCDCGNTHKVE